MKAQDSIVEILKTESNAANEIICEILDSYMEFITLMEKTLERSTVPPKLNEFAKILIMQRRDMWKPVVEHVNKRKGNLYDGV